MAVLSWAQQTNKKQQNPPPLAAESSGGLGVPHAREAPTTATTDQGQHGKKRKKPPLPLTQGLNKNHQICTFAILQKTHNLKSTRK